MQTNGWYYGEPGGEAHGPLDIQAIRAAADVGRLSGDISVSRSVDGPWAPLRVVEKLGDDAFGAGGKKRAARLAEKMALEDKMGTAPRSVGGYIEVVGYVIIGAGLVCILGIFFATKNNAIYVFPLTIGAASNIVTGLLFLAVAEGLKRLGEIASALRK